MTSSTTGPDIRQLKEKELPAAEFPGDARADFRVCIDPKIHEQIQKQAKEQISVEVCGVLVGKWGRDSKGPFVSITAAIPGEAATNKLAEVTFTHETWAKINARMDKEFTSDSIVGWYHTHPDFGIFLSDRDRFIHEHFFNGPGQVAYVVDPVRDEEGMFIWSRGKATPAPYYWVGGKIRVAPPSEDGKERRSESRATREDRDDAQSDQRVDRNDLGPIWNWTTLVLFALCFLMLGYMIAGTFGSRERQKLVEYILLDRVRLNRDLSAVGQALQDAQRPLMRIANNRNPAVPEIQIAFTETAMQLMVAQQQMEGLRQRFGIDPREVGQLADMLARQSAELKALMNADKGAATKSTTAPASTQAVGASGAGPGADVISTTQPTTKPVS